MVAHHRPTISHARRDPQNPTPPIYPRRMILAAGIEMIDTRAIRALHIDSALGVLREVEYTIEIAVMNAEGMAGIQSDALIRRPGRIAIAGLNVIEMKGGVAATGADAAHCENRAYRTASIHFNTIYLPFA